MDKKIFIKTFGCQMNVYDSQRVFEMMESYGYSMTEIAEEAELIVINTCHIREKAASKLFSELGKFKITKDIRKKDGKSTIIIVMGCTAQAMGIDIKKRAPYIDIITGPREYHKIPEIIKHLSDQEYDYTALHRNNREKFDKIGTNRKISSVSALLSVQEGCDKFCTYCIVPYTRGFEYSRSVESVIEESLSLAENGVKEIVLLGQNISAYNGSDRKSSLAELIQKIAEIKEIKRIRYLTSHPRDMKKDLIDAHKNIDKLMPFLHLPVQSGSDKILQSMNRKYTAEKYLNLIDDFRSAVPSMSFSSDFIVGFPGETDEDFEQTLDIVKKVKYSQAFSFKYSPRDNTPAALMEQLPESIKDERLQILQKILFEQQEEFNKSIIGHTIPVLIEKEGRYDGQLHGRSPYLQSVHFDCKDNKIGDIVNISITSASQNSLTGTLI